MNPSVCIQESLPDDIALKIASFLQVFDVCGLGSCSRFWRELCGSDCLWESLCKDRWPTLDLSNNSPIFDAQNCHLDQQLVSDLKWKWKWKGQYIKKHNEMAGKASFVVEYVNRRLSSEDSIEVGYYLKAIEDLCTMQLGFMDVEIFFLKPNISVVFNLIGLHYCITWLHVPVEDVMKTLKKCKISEREVSVQWWKLGRWFHGFRLRDELHSRNVSLENLITTSNDGEILGVLQRGTIHEVLRVQISAVKPTFSSWFSQTAESSSRYK